MNNVQEIQVPTSTQRELVKFLDKNQKELKTIFPFEPIGGMRVVCYGHGKLASVNLLTTGPTGHEVIVQDLYRADHREIYDKVLYAVFQGLPNYSGYWKAMWTEEDMKDPTDQLQLVFTSQETWPKH